MRFCQRASRSLIMLILGAVIGTGAGALVGQGISPNSTLAHLHVPTHVAPFSFTSSACTDASAVDPIGVVYTLNATYSRIHGHSSIHGGWSTNDGTTATQYFYDHGCSAMDGQNATAGITSSRYHQRFEVTNGPDINWQTYALSTPHYEDIVICGVLPRHAVRENESASMPEGGYINAKDEIRNQWTAHPHHALHTPQVWDNIRRFQQCDGQWAWGNGIVDFIEIIN